MEAILGMFVIYSNEGWVYRGDEHKRESILTKKLNIDLKIVFIYF